MAIKLNARELDARIRVGKRLREIREQSGHTISEASSKLGISSSVISRIENGKHSFGIDVVIRYCYLFDSQLDIS